MGKSRGAYRVLVGKLEEIDHFEDEGIDGRINLRWIFRGWHEGAWTGLIWLRIGRGTCGHGNEYSGSIQCGNLTS